MSAISTNQLPAAYCGKDQLTALSTVKSLSPPANARWAILVPESQAIRISLAGGSPGTPTAADMLIAVGQPVEITTSLADVRVLEAAASAKVNVWYFG
ncbi:hypothetical protein [Reyranella sp.]|uniref:hypothetical protein n=1 Tax=Reyranella sp. TaxID=1929291 RepID=UPI003BAA50FE